MLQGIGRYQIQAPIGHGATADVYRAYDPTLDRILAIKVLKPEFSRDAEYAARFLREARAAAALSHPNIVTVFDVGDADGAPYIAMELLDGESLDKLMARGRMPTADVVRLGVQLAEALGYAHELGVVHRDIKPSNINLSADGRTLKILDFGIARLRESEIAADLLHTRVGQLVGTPRYMSPEQALSREIDGRSDLFSAGVVLYELLTGAKAFAGTTAVALALQITQQDPKPIGELAPEAPRGLQFIVGKLLAKRPERRFATGGQLAEALRREQHVLSAVEAEGGARRRSLPLPVQVTLVMAAVTALALFVSIGAVLHRQDAALRQMSATSGAAIASFVANNATLPAAEGDWLPVQAFVKAAAADPNIREIVVADAQGVVQAASRPGRVGLAHQPGATQDGDQRFVRTITYAGRTFGRVDVAISGATTRSASALSKTLLGVLALIVLAVVAAGSYLVARAMADPVRRLKRAIVDVSAGDLDFRLSHHRRDEFGELFDAFNRMAAVMQERLEAAEMERRDRPLVIGTPVAIAEGSDLDLTQIGLIDPELTLVAARP